MFFKIIKNLFIVVPSILAAWFAYEGVSLQREQILKESLPFFRYSYSEDLDAFIVESEDDVSIHSVKWFFPYSTKEIKMTGYSLLNNSNYIKIDEIVSVIWEPIINRGNAIPPPHVDKNVYDYVKCAILKNFDDFYFEGEKSPGFTMGTEIEFTRKGYDVASSTDLILIRDFQDTFPKIRSVASGVSEHELMNYIKDGARFLNIIMSKEYNTYESKKQYADSSGKCNQFDERFQIHFFNQEDAMIWQQRFKDLE